MRFGDDKKEAMGSLKMTGNIYLFMNDDVKQGSFKHFHKARLSFGGDLLGPKTNPKGKRPLDSKLPIHLVLKAKRSWMRSPKHFAPVNQTLQRVAKRHGVRIYEHANVGNHLHVVLKISRRPRWAAFIRELTGRLATLAGGGGVWAKRPFTRVVNGWRRAYQSVREYVRLNTMEAELGLDAATREEFRRLHKLWRVKNPEDRPAA